MIQHKPAHRGARRWGAALLLLAAGCCAAGLAAAQSVELTGTMGDRALLVIDGGAPQVLQAGQTVQGVTLISADRDVAEIEILGQRQRLRVGQSPVRLNAPAGEEARVVLQAGSGGHYFGTGRINGLTVPFVVDTGASDVVIGANQAEHLGLSYQDGERGAVSTANGVVASRRIWLDSVRIGAIEVFHVQATVVPADMPAILLGNSVLARFRWHQENDRLVLERR